MADDEISEEDRNLFRQMMTSVKPLAGSKKMDNKLIKTSPSSLPSRKSRKPEQSTEKPVTTLSSMYPEEVQAHTILSYTTQSIPNKRFRELKNGQIPWQARLDLHGLTTEEAEAALPVFIAQHYEAEHRCVLIIHGKGGHSHQTPILKNLTNHWLKQIPTVLAFHSAIAKDGGTGALYVLLKRKRV